MSQTHLNLEQNHRNKYHILKHTQGLKLFVLMLRIVFLLLVSLCVNYNLQKIDIKEKLVLQKNCKLYDVALVYILFNDVSPRDFYAPV